MSSRNVLQFSTQINSSTASQVQDTSSESGNEEELPTMSANRDVEVLLFYKLIKYTIRWWTWALPRAKMKAFQHLLSSARKQLNSALGSKHFGCCLLSFLESHRIIVFAGSSISRTSQPSPKKTRFVLCFTSHNFKNEMLDCHARGLLGSIYHARDNRVADSDDKGPNSTDFR